MKKAVLAALTLVTLLPANPAIAIPRPADPNSKITFDISSLSPEGLSPNGGGSISYEFCIPATETHLAEVQTIDPSVKHFQHSKGRIGCRSDQYLCIGSTHQPNWQQVLFNLAKQDYIHRIDRFWGE
jgi:hypothetical protein